MSPAGRILGEAREVEGLPGPLGDRLVLGASLPELQRAAFAAGGLDEAGTAGLVVAPPNLAFSAPAVAAAVAAGRARGGDLRLVPGTDATRALAALTGSAAGLTWLAPDGSPDLAARVAAAPEAPLPAEERALPGFDLPDGPLRVADAWMVPVEHWVQLLWANLLGLGPHLWGALVGRGLWPLLRLPWAAVRAGSLAPESVAARLTRLGPGARVHPRAVVEASVLGPGARVGAGAVVRGAILGAGAVVEELAIVEGVVIGAGARVQRQALAKFAVIEDGAAHAGIVQLGVVGRGAQVKMGATLMDMAFGQDVRVRVGAALARAPQGMCGGCVGPGTVVGSGVRVAPGRALPPGVVILADPDAVLRDVSLPPSTARAVVRNGALEPF